MSLIPLEQWICDTCGELIEEADHGWVEWLADDNHRVRAFRICHHAVHSPREGGCYVHTDAPGRSDLHMKDMLGNAGMVHMLSMLDVGAVLNPDPKPKHLMAVEDPRNWVETFRRLFLPFYEEGRFCFGAAAADGFFDGANELTPYLEENLRVIIDKYGPAKH